MITKGCGPVRRFVHRMCRQYDRRVIAPAVMKRYPDQPRQQSMLWTAYIREQDHWWCACAKRVGSPPEPIDAMVIRARRGRIGV